MAIMKIQKRNGAIVDFQPTEIIDAIYQAAKAVGGDDKQEAARVAEKVIKILDTTFPDAIPSVEEVQDIVEKTLIEMGHAKTAKAYILYRQKKTEMRSSHHVVVEVEKSMEEYLNKLDWRVNANSNQGYSLGGLILNVAGKVTANYWLSHIYPKSVGDAHRNGDYHIHDLDMFSGYCAGWSLRQLLEEGFNGIPDKIESAAPKNLSAALAQMVNFLGTLQNEWAGAQAFSSFDTYLAPFVHKYSQKLRDEIETSGIYNFPSKEAKEQYIDEKTYKYVYDEIQAYVFNLNVPSRWGTQCVDEITECLTDSGWKKHYEIQPTDKILTLNIEKNTYEYLTPLKVTAYDFDGKMHVLKNRTQEQWITPKHRVVRKVFNTKQKYVLEEIENILSLKSPIIIPNSWETSSKKTLDPLMIQLLAWVVAEGNFDVSEGRTRVSLFQSEANYRYVTEIRGILNMLDFSYHEKKKEKSGFSNTPSYRIRLNKKESDIVAKFTQEKVVPPIIKTLSKDCIQLFLETYIKGDGTEESNGRLRIYTSNKKNLDALQELCVLIGWGSTVNQRENGVFVLNILRNKESYIQKIEQRYYKGKVWCPTTKNGTFVARRNGKTFITGNTPFTNITLDWKCPADLRSKSLKMGGEYYPVKFGDLEKEMGIVNRAYIEVMTHGDARGRVFTFPIPTYNITKDFDWETPNADLLFEMTAKYGTPYFQNFINSELNPGDVRSMCCRLQLDLKELLKRGGGLFGSAEMTGSIGVVTISAPRIGYLNKGDKDKFFERLEHLMNLSKTSLEMKRDVIQTWIDRGLFPYTKRYLGTLKNHFSTIGVNGINEAVKNFFDGAEDITTELGGNFAEEILLFMREKLVEFQEETGNLYNLEASPAEGTTYRFAKEDHRRFPDIIQAGTEENPYYTNSSQLPVEYTTDAFEALMHQDRFQTKYTGGTVLHLYMGERITNSDSCKNLVKKALTNFRLPYITISPTFSICPKHGYLAGEHDYCPKCDAEMGLAGSSEFDEETRKVHTSKERKAVCCK